MSVGTREILLAQRSTMGALEDRANRLMNSAIDGRLIGGASTPIATATMAHESNIHGTNSYHYLDVVYFDLQAKEEGFPAARPGSGSDELGHTRKL